MLMLSIRLKVKIMLKLVKYMTVILLGVFVLSSCKKDEEEAAPELPPESSMQMNFFKNDKNEFLAQRTSQTFKNWTASAVTVGVYNTVLTVTLALPVASFKAAFNHKGEWQEKGKWKWSYNFPHKGNTYTAELFATRLTNGIGWEMKINGPGVPGFVWYTGTSSDDGKSGNWVINHSVQNPKPLYHINWSKSGSEIGKIKYTLGSAHKDEGAYVEYGLVGGNQYDAFYDIVNPKNASQVNVKWHRKNHIGSIFTKGLKENYDGCWNNKLEDISCAD